MVRRCISILFCVLLCFCSVMLSSFSAYAEDSEENLTQNKKRNNSSSYFDYFSEYAGAKGYAGFVEVSGKDFSDAENPEKAIGAIEDVTAAILNEDNEWCEWEVNLPADGRYSIYVDYSFISIPSVSVQKKWYSCLTNLFKQIVIGRDCFHSRFATQLRNINVGKRLADEGNKPNSRTLKCWNYL